MSLITAALGGLGIGFAYTLLLTLREVYTLIPFYAPRWTVYAGLMLRIVVALGGFALVIVVFRGLDKSGDNYMELALVATGTVLVPVLTRKKSKRVANWLRPRLLPSRKRDAA